VGMMIDLRKPLQVVNIRTGVVENNCPIIIREPAPDCRNDSVEIKSGFFNDRSFIFSLDDGRCLHEINNTCIFTAPDTSPYRLENRKLKVYEVRMFDRAEASTADEATSMVKKALSLPDYIRVYASEVKDGKE
jgi:hypothetical protein